jgi:hypothetical protein
MRNEIGMIVEIDTNVAIFEESEVGMGVVWNCVVFAREWDGDLIGCEEL